MAEKKSFKGLCRWMWEVHTRGITGIGRSVLDNFKAAIIFGAWILSISAIVFGVTSIFMYWLHIENAFHAEIFNLYIWGIIAVVGYFSAFMIFYFVEDGKW